MSNCKHALLACAAALALAFGYAEADAQTSPNFTQGQVPSVGQWNALFAGKQDYPLNQPACAALQWTGSAITCNAALGAAVTGGGTLLAEQLCAITGDYTLANGTAPQQALNCSTNGQVIVGGATLYEFEAEYFITNTGTSSHTWSVAFGGGFSATAIAYDAIAVSSTSSSAPTAASQLWANVASATAVTAASTSATENVTIRLRGTLRVNAGGSFQPQVKLSAAPGGTQLMKLGSFFRIWSIGPSSGAAFGNWQ